MLKSKELRQKAWNSLKGKYWLAFAATIISGIIISISSYFSNLAADIVGINETAMQGGTELEGDILLGASVILAMGIVVGIVAIILTAFIQGPAIIGGCNYFIKNIDGKPSVAEVFSGFNTSYMRNVGTMLLTNIKLYLWSILFIIPGVIKAFEYAIIPYILADNPEIKSKDAFKQAKEMMRGNKWRLFKLNFSFIGWIILCIPTLGIGAFFLVPYIDAANAEFYAELKK